MGAGTGLFPWSLLGGSGLVFISLAVFWGPSWGTDPGDLALASSETAGNGFQSWWGGVAGGVRPARAPEGFQEQPPLLQPTQLRLPPGPAPLNPWGLPQSHDSPCQDMAGSPASPQALPATLASSEACRPSGGFLSCWVSGLRRGKELCQMRQPKPSLSPHAWAPTRVAPPARPVGQRIRESCKEGTCTAQSCPSLLPPIFPPSVPALAPSPARSSAPSEPVDTARAQFGPCQD